MLRAGQIWEISIHALREEGDVMLRDVRSNVTDDFYPRPPRGGRRDDADRVVVLVQFLSTPSARRATETSVNVLARVEFLSTPSARRATTLSSATIWRTTNFYPRPPRGGRRLSWLTGEPIKEFLSTPSARRATGMTRIVSWYLFNFYPRPPRGGRLSVWLLVKRKVSISIHALREEGDFPFLGVCGRAKAFLSTPSARRATRTPSV